MRADELAGSAAETELDRRARITQATLDKFRDQPFAFGKCDCVRIAGFHLREMGYNPKLARGGAYKSALGAKAALNRAGYGSLAEALDGLYLPRIAPARAKIGDLVMGEGDLDEYGIGILSVYLGNGRILTFAEGYPSTVVGQPKLAPTAAWEVRPRG